METKLITVLDRATEIGVIVIRLTKLDSVNMPILRNAGYFGSDYVFYMPLDGFMRGRVETSPFDWGDRTHTQAHNFIEKNWNTIDKIVDIEIILGEK